MSALKGQSIAFMKKRAIWNDQVIAESSDLVHIEGNYYFPRNSVNESSLKDSSTTTHCPWKGDASYHTIVVNGKENQDAAWYYSQPKDAASAIMDRIAFWRGVEIVDA